MLANVRNAAAIVGICLSIVTAGHASCLPGVPPPTFYVGSDNKCNYSKIQDAISAVSTTATCAPIIYVTSEHKPWNEALTITNRTFTLIGTTSACGTGGTHGSEEVAADTTPQATISGAGQNTPVITINGSSNVTLQALEVTGGNIDQNSEGGGIFFNGTGSLTLNSTTVDNNQAGYGGGIDMSPTGKATLTLQQNAQVLNNTAEISGGGIRIEGQTRLFMLDDGSTVSFNQAQFDYGGGIEIIGPARADIGSSGAVFVGAVSNNSAPYGGGVAILGSSDGSATARVFTTSAAQPVLISGNTASALGGAFYLKPDAQNDADTNATLCAYSYRIDNNSAPDGAAIFGDSDADNVVLYGSNVYLNSTDNCGPESPASLGAVTCAPGGQCNEISSNDALDNHGNPSGAIVTMETYDNFAVDRLAMRNNHAKEMILAESPYEGVINYLHSCLIVDNHSSQELIHSDSSYFGDALTIANCTVAGNTIDNGYAI